MFKMFRKGFGYIKNMLARHPLIVVAAQHLSPRLSLGGPLPYGRGSVTSCKERRPEGSAPLLPDQGLKLPEEGFFVLKVPVHRSKADVGDLVEAAQTLHEQFSYCCSR